jgi:putative transposase
MIAREHDLPLKRQAELLQLSRGSLYYQPEPVSAEDLELMRRMDELHLQWPFMGSRMLRDQLRLQGLTVNRKRVRRLMRLMGMEAIYRRQNTSKRHPEHAVFPYLLRGLVIDQPSQVWAAYITYVPMARGFVYLFAVMDWYSRKVLAWRISNTMTADFCIEAVQEAIDRFGKPQIFNTDQGSQFTSSSFVSLLTSHGIRISMDGKGCWRDNVFVERLWRSVKYEEVYLYAYQGVAEARTAIGRYFAFYNARRTHSALDRQTPDHVYFKSIEPLPLAKAA